MQWLIACTQYPKRKGKFLHFNCPNHFLGFALFRFFFYLTPVVSEAIICMFLIISPFWIYLTGQPLAYSVFWQVYYYYLFTWLIWFKWQIYGHTNTSKLNNHCISFRYYNRHEFSIHRIYKYACMLHLLSMNAVYCIHNNVCTYFAWLMKPNVCCVCICVQKRSFAYVHRLEIHSIFQHKIK